MLSVFDVFVTGGIPTATYNPRDNRRLTDDLSRIEDGRHTLGAVHGPTKCGKSVLIAKALRLPVQIEGVQLTSVDSLWYQLASKLEISADERSSFEYTESGGSERSTAGNAAVARHEATASESDSISRSREWSSPKTLSQRVKERLAETHRVVVIDDFHHASDEVRTNIVRHLKAMLFEGIPVVLASVSHRAYDAVFAEPEMEGRVSVLEVPPWDESELADIGTEGFKALNVTVPEQVVLRLAREALGSPQLMQLFCQELCLHSGVREEQPELFEVAPSDEDLTELFQDIARRSPAVSRLNQIKLGPNERGHERNRMTTTQGNEVDIYGAILLAVAACGPTSEIPYRDLKAKITELLADGNPTATQIKNTLSQQSRIAEELVAKYEFVDPPLYWNAEFETLHIVDPNLSFFVRWGDLQLGRS